MFCTNGAIIAPTWTHSYQSSWRSQTARPLPLIPRTFGAVSSERVAHNGVQSDRLRRGYAGFSEQAVVSVFEGHVARTGGG